MKQAATVMVLSRRQAAQMIGCHERTLDRLHNEGIGPARIQLTRKRCGYALEAVQRWLKSRSFGSQAAAIKAEAIIVVSPEAVEKAKETRARTKAAAEQQAQHQAKQKAKRAS
jgi:hypothetical protein